MAEYNENEESYRYLADELEHGRLEQAAVLMSDNKALYETVGLLIQDERLRVRIGVTVLLEDLKEMDPENIHRALPSLLPLLETTALPILGDVIALVGIAGSETEVPFLEPFLKHENDQVVGIAQDAIDEILGTTPKPLIAVHELKKAQEEREKAEKELAENASVENEPEEKEGDDELS